eukprot:jgi/Bigna1/129333/aug1.8_g4041
MIVGWSEDKPEEEGITSLIGMIGGDDIVATRGDAGAECRVVAAEETNRRRWREPIFHIEITQAAKIVEESQDSRSLLKLYSFNEPPQERRWDSPRRCRRHKLLHNEVSPSTERLVASVVRNGMRVEKTLRFVENGGGETNSNRTYPLGMNQKRYIRHTPAKRNRKTSLFLVLAHETKIVLGKQQNESDDSSVRDRKRLRRRSGKEAGEAAPPVKGKEKIEAKEEGRMVFISEDIIGGGSNTANQKKKQGCWPSNRSNSHIYPTLPAIASKSSPSLPAPAVTSDSVLPGRASSSSSSSSYAPVMMKKLREKGDQLSFGLQPVKKEEKEEDQERPKEKIATDKETVIAGVVDVQKQEKEQEEQEEEEEEEEEKAVAAFTNKSIGNSSSSRRIWQQSLKKMKKRYREEGEEEKGEEKEDNKEGGETGSNTDKNKKKKSMQHKGSNCLKEKKDLEVKQPSCTSKSINDDGKNNVDIGDAFKKQINKVVIKGIGKHLNRKIWRTSYLLNRLGNMMYHQFRRYVIIPRSSNSSNNNGVEGGGGGGGGGRVSSANYSYEEKDWISMKVSDYKSYVCTTIDDQGDYDEEENKKKKKKKKKRRLIFDICSMFD